MGERLKQIWAGFEETTTRQLAGKGVEDIHVPLKHELAVDNGEFLPENFEAPAEAAFAALRADLAAKEKKFGRSRQRGAQDVNAFAADAKQIDASKDGFDGDGLIKGMMATSMRVDRTEMNYEAFLSTDQGKAALKKRRKKFLGIF